MKICQEIQKQPFAGIFKIGILRRFSVNLAEILREAFSMEHLWRLLQPCSVEKLFGKSQAIKNQLIHQFLYE